MAANAQDRTMTRIQQQYFMKAVFGQCLDTAVLRAPLTHFNGAVCLKFQYKLSHPKISLSLNSSSTPLMELNHRPTLYVNASKWNDAKITLNSPDDQVQLAFVAEKIGFTSGPEYAAIRNIVMTNSPCPESDENNQQREFGENYTGIALPFDSFKELVLNDTEQYNISDLMTLAGHSHEHLIYRCEWNGAPCDEADIRNELTDLGLCTTFNGNENRVLTSTRTGADFGLRLVLNVEQYDDARFLSENNGIKIHLRNYDDVPQVKDNGFTVSPGFKTLAPLDHETVVNLEPPWGSCGENRTDFINSSDRYTTARCQLACKTRSLVYACGCKQAYMPGPNRSCSLAEYLNCAKSWIDQKHCTCPIECYIYSYTTSLSFSPISDVELVNNLSSTHNITRQYWHSQDISNRVDDTEMMRTVYGLESVIIGYRGLISLVVKNILNPATSTTHLILKALEKLLGIVGNDADTSLLFLQRFQECYDRKVNFVVQTTLDQLKEASKDLGKLQSFDESLTADNYTTVLEKINQTVQLVNFYLFSVSEEENGSCPVNLGQRCNGAIRSLLSKINAMKVLTGQCDASRMQSISASGLGSALIPSSRLSTAGGCALFNKGSNTKMTGYLSDAQLNISQVELCISTYAEFLKAFKSFLENIDRSVPQVDMAVATSSISKLSAVANRLEDLLKAYRKGSLTKRDLATKVLNELNNDRSSSLESALSVSQSLILPVINTVEKRTISVYTQLIKNLNNLQAYMPVKTDHVTKFAKKLSMWRSPIPTLQDKTLFAYRLSEEDLKNSLGAEVTFDSIVNRTQTIINPLVYAYDTSLKQTLNTVQTELHSAQQNVSDLVNKLIQQLTNFSDSGVIGNNFIWNNIVKVDIYYGELRNLTIQQTKGYDIVQFLGDFGGWFGLFLGGSLLSIFEFLDTIIYKFIANKMSNRKHKSSSSDDVLPTSQV